MSLATTIAGAVATIKKVTDSLQAEVELQQWESQSGYGAETHGPSKVYKALVNQTVQPIRTASGQIVQTKAQITFLEPITPNGADNRVNPIDSRDIITLPDKTTGPIVKVDGFVNPDINAPYFAQVWLG